MNGTRPKVPGTAARKQEPGPDLGAELRPAFSTERYTLILASVFSDLNDLVKSGYPRDVANSLKGLDTPEAWKLREELVEEESGAVASSLEGLDTPRAWKLRENWAEKFPFDVANSLKGLDTPEAWELRERILEKNRHRPYVLTALLR